MKKIRYKKQLSALLFMAFILSFSPITAFASTYVTDTKVISVTANDGSGIPATESFTKDSLTTTLTKKSVTYAPTETKQVPVYKITGSKQVSVNVPGSSTSSSYPSTYAYSDANGFTGTLTKSGDPIVTGGTYTPADSKTVTATSAEYKYVGQIPATYNYNSGGYTGTLTKSGSPYVSSGYYIPPMTSQEIRTDVVISPTVYNYSYMLPYGSWVTSYEIGYSTPQWYENYYSDGWTGTLSLSSTSTINLWTTWESPPPYTTVLYQMFNYQYIYQGYVYKTSQEVDTRMWRQQYSGTVTKPASDTRTYAQTYTGTATTQVIDHYETVPTKWDATVVYDGYLNYGPKADFTLPTYGFTGDTINVANNSSDPDGTIASNTWTLSPTTGVIKNLSDNGGTISFSAPGKYSLTLLVKDNDGSTATVTKSIQIYAGTVKPEVSLNVTPNPVNLDQAVTYTDSMACPNGIDKFIYTVTNTDTNTSQSYENIKPPTVFPSAGNYKITLKALGKSIDYGSGIIALGKWSDEASCNLVVKSDMRINALTLTEIVNPPLGTAAPINYPVDTPTKIKAGYNLKYNLTADGGDTVIIKLYCNGNPVKVQTSEAELDQLEISKNISDKNVSFSFWLDKSMAKDTVLDMKIILQTHNDDGTVSSIVNTEFGEQYSKIIGSSLEDQSVNLTN